MGFKFNLWRKTKKTVYSFKNILTAKVFFLFILLGCEIFSFSQARYFQHLTKLEGISQSEVYSFLEDSRGFMWFGTVDGLNRYDGYNITVFNTDRSDPNSISNNTIRSLAEDKYGRIWIGTDDGLCFYNPLLEKIVQVKINCVNKDILLKVQAITIDENYILVATASGLLRANIATANLEQISQGFYWVDFSNNYMVDVPDVTRCKDGSIYIATSGFLYRMAFQNENKKPFIIEKVSDNSLADDINIRLEEDKFSNLWIITHQNGFSRYNPSIKKLDHFTVNPSNPTVPTNMYSYVVKDKNDNLWISTLDRGLLFLKAEHLNEINPKFESIQTSPIDEKSLNSNLIFSLYVSRSNLLWVGTIGSGINVFDPNHKKFNRIRIPQCSQQSLSGSNFIRSVYNYDESNIWMGTHNNGLYIFDRRNNSFRKAGFESQSIFYIYGIGDGNTLVCSSKGVSVIKLANNEVSMVNSIISHAYFYACKSKNDIFWLAGLGGVKKCRIVQGIIQVEKEYTSKTTPRISLNNCRVLFYDKEKNELLVGTEGGGLNVLKLDDQQNVVSVSVYKKNDAANSISNNYIRSIIKDSNGDFWIGTYEGLNKMMRNPGSGNISFKSYTNRDGLPNNMIQSLVEDNQKKLWIGTNGGLSRLDIKSGQFVNYSESDGLQSNEFSEHTVFKNLDGEIIMGGTNGINTFYPENITSNNTPPKTTITGFYLFNKKVKISDGAKSKTPLKKSIALTDTIYLEPDQTSFGFDFSAMLHSNPGKVNYAYKLEGFDKNWNFTDAKNRRANYTNLKHGNYVFTVKASSIDGKWEDTPRRIVIHIKTPFYYTWVAFVIYIVMIVLLIIYFTTHSVIKYTTKKKMLLENEHNKKLHELDELRTRFFINISHDLRTPLTLISSPLEIVLKNKQLTPDVKNHLNLIQRNVKKLRYFTEQLLDVSKAEAGKLSTIRKSEDIVSFLKKEAAHFTYAVKSKGLEFHITSKEAAIHSSFDADMVSKVFFNLLSNAIKNTHKGEINISIEKVSEHLPLMLKDSKYNRFIRVDIQDSGEGIEQQELDKIFDRFYQGKGKAEKGYGIGLSHCKDLIEAMEGAIEANSEKGIGTTFSIFIPDIQTEEQTLERGTDTGHTEDIYVESLSSGTDQEFTSNLQKVLVIEDNPDMRNFIKNELRKEYNVLEASDGKEGLGLTEKFAPELIVCDVMMPNMDGIEFCKRIKSNINTSHIPVILLTAKADTSTKYQGIELGADDYITKPFEMEYLGLRIKNLLKTREQLRRMFQTNTSLTPSAVTVTSLDEKFLSQLMEEIEKGIPDPSFTINSLESKMAMSHSNFYRKIKSLTGQSGKDLLLSMRMKRAKQILTDNKGIRISEVAYMVGYENPKYFSQSFKDYFGVLPSEMNSEN